MYITITPSPVGEITLASDGENLTGLWLAGQKYFGAGLPADHKKSTVQTKDDLPLFITVRDWLTRYFNCENPPAKTLPLAPAGSPFRQKAWQALLDIPYGTTTTYSLLGRQIGCTAARAVGGAVGHNPISIIIPCHRVVGANGKLTGYAGGVEVKQKLLVLESSGSQSATH